MPIFLRNGKKCLFIHVPKTAGTAVELQAEHFGWKKHFSINGVSSQDLSFMKVTPQHFHAKLLQEVFNFDQFDEVISVCRNPVSRMKSEFYWQEKTGQTDLPPEDWIPFAFETHRNDPYCFDNHLRPQKEFFDGIQNLKLFQLEKNGVELALNCLFLHGKDASGQFRWHKRLRQPKTGAKKSIYRAEVEAAFQDAEEEIKVYYSEDCNIYNSLI